MEDLILYGTDAVTHPDIPLSVVDDARKILAMGCCIKFYHKQDTIGMPSVVIYNAAMDFAYKVIVLNPAENFGKAKFDEFIRDYERFLKEHARVAQIE